MPGTSRLPCLLALFSLAASAPAAAEPVAVVLSGDPAPDGNGAFTSFEPIPTINGHGQVAFVGTLTGTQGPPLDTRGVFLTDGQSVQQLVRGGDPTPGADGVFELFAFDLNDPEQLALNDSGVVAFNALLDGTSGSPFDASAMFTASALGVTEIVRLGDPAPDGNGVFGFLEDDLRFSAPGLDAFGGLSFQSELGETSGGEEVDDLGVFASDGGAPFRVLRTGALAPGGDGIVDQIPAFSSNTAGHVAVHAFVVPTVFPPSGDDIERIYVHDGAGLDEVFRSGVPAPDANGTLVSIGAPGFAGAGAATLVLAESGTVVFQARVVDYTPVDLQYDGGTRLLTTDGTTLRLIARQGDLGPQETVFRFTAFYAIDANAQDRIAFSAILEQNQAPAPFRTSGIYFWNGASLQRLVREGDPAPDGNGVFGDLVGAVFLNERDEVVFSAQLEDTASPGTDGLGLFLARPGEGVRQLARSGMALAGSNILFLSYLGDIFIPPDRLAQAGLRALDDAGRVTFQATLADGRFGVFLAPEPAGTVLSLTAVAALAALRRRRASTPRLG